MLEKLGSGRGLALVIGGHIVGWTLLAIAAEPNAPLDVIEMTFWGHAWQWGYHKHPPLAAWLAETARCVGGLPAVFLTSQLCVGLALYAAWRLARDLFTPVQAAAAVLALEGCYYYHYLATELNNNVALLPCWAMATWCAWRASRSGRAGDWLALGLWLGLALLAKYTAVFLALALAGYLVTDPAARRCWRTCGPWLALAGCLALLGPHLRWAAEHDWVTLRYAAARSETGDGWWSGHVVSPVKFALAQCLALAPCAVILWPVVARPWRSRLAEADPQARRFLLWGVLGPCAAHLLLGLLLGLRLRSMWGSPFWTFSSVLALLALRTVWNREACAELLRRVVVVVGVFVIVMQITFPFGPYLTGQPGRVHFPGSQLAALVTSAWRERHPGPLPLVGGPWWLAGNVAFYSPDRPQVYGDLDPVVSPWASDEQLREHGGAIVWDATESAEVPDRVRSHFPTAVPVTLPPLPYRTGAAVPPVRIGLAIVPPSASRP